MNAGIGMLFVIVLLIVAGISLYKEATFWNLVGTFFLLCFISYFTLYQLDVSTS